MIPEFLRSRAFLFFRLGHTARRAAVCAMLVACALAAGCMSPSMRGTTLYTDEYGKGGIAHERLNLWPLVYYRSPAFSAFWPLIEKSPAYFAIRPVWSGYRESGSNGVYSVLWPLAAFDRGSQDSRIFPVYWGDGYATVFPFYWHSGSPFGTGGGLDALIPLWWYSRASDGYDTQVVWPVFNFKRKTNERGWRVWPVVGSYQAGSGGTESTYRFLAWPLGHQWSEAGGDTRGSMFFPLYAAAHDRDGDVFASLPVSFGERRDGSNWKLVLPLGFRHSDAEGRGVYTLLGGRGQSQGGRASWSYLTPLLVNRRTETSRLFVSLPVYYHRQPKRVAWVAPLLLSGGSREADSSQWWGLGPMVHAARGPEGVRRHAIPFFYYADGPDGRLLLSVPWSSGGSDGNHWQFVPFLYLHQEDAAAKRTFTPLYAQGVAGDHTWRTVVPLFYRSVSPERRLTATLLGGRETDRDGSTMTIYPLLSGGRVRRDGSGSLWVVAPLFHARWNTNGVSSHLLPLYYRDADEGSLYSLLMAQWTDENGCRETVVPPLLSLFQSAADRRDLWAVGPLAHVSWGEHAGSSHVFPFFYRDPGRATITPVYATWQSGTKRTWLYPPLLSRTVRDGDHRRLDVLLGLGSEQWGGGERAGHLFPFYLHEDGFNRFYSLLFGWRRDPDDGFVYPVTPLVGFRTGHHAGGWVFPLFSRDRDLDTGTTRSSVLWGSYTRDGDETSSSMIPLYAYRRYGRTQGPSGTNAVPASSGKTFWCLPACWYRNTVESRKDGSAVRTLAGVRSGFFPFWVHSRDIEGGREEASTWILGPLYDWRHRVTPAREGAVAEDYTRHRVLWRLWHYERLNGEVGVDAFPGLTYDRSADGTRAFSFLWRVFRYERLTAGVKVHLFFIPIVR